MKQIVTTKVKLELVGLDGNAFSVMGAFQKAARRQGVPKSEIDAVLAEAMSGDYDHLLATIIANTESPDEEEEDDFSQEREEAEDYKNQKRCDHRS